MSFAKIRLPMGIIGTLTGIVFIIFPLTEVWKWKEARWTNDSMTLGVILVIGCLSLVFGLYCIVQDMDKLDKYLFGRSDSNNNG